MHQDQRPSYFVNLGWGPGRTLWLRAGAVQLRCKRCKSMWHPHNWRGELGRRCTKQKGAVLRWYFPGMKRKQIWLDARQGAQEEVEGAGRGWWILSLNPQNSPGRQVLLLPKMEQFSTASKIYSWDSNPKSKVHPLAHAVSSVFTVLLCWEWLAGVEGRRKEGLLGGSHPVYFTKSLQYHGRKTFQLMGHPMYLVIPLTKCHWDLQALFLSFFFFFLLF